MTRFTRLVPGDTSAFLFDQEVYMHYTITALLALDLFSDVAFFTHAPPAEMAMQHMRAIPPVLRASLHGPFRQTEK